MTITKIDFDPDKKSIKDIFEGSVRMMIPRYQRSYSWTKDKVEEFYEDFIIESEKAEDNLAYLGTILFSKDLDGNLEVIDGQQRLVTITIFFAAMRDLSKNFINSEKSRNFSSGLQKLIRTESVFGNSFLDDSHADNVKLKVGADIEELFNKMIYGEVSDVKSITPRITAEKNVINAYNLFYSRVKQSIDHTKLTSDMQLKLVVRLVQKILSIEYIDIRVLDNEVAYNLFESHNAKGVALAKTDLIKNYYFGRLKGVEVEKNNKMDEWDALLQSLEDNTTHMLPDRFFNYMIESYDGHFSSAVLYRRIKPHIQNTSVFYKMLKSNINNMIDLKTAHTGNATVDISLNGIEKMRVNQCFIFLLCLHRNRLYMNMKSYQVIVEIIEKFTYLYSAISKQPTNALEKIYSKHSKKLQEEIFNLGDFFKLTSIDKERLGGKTLSSLRSDLLELVPAQSVFLDGLSNLSYDNLSQRIMIRYTFEKIESYKSNGLVKLSGLFTLDHINPKNKATLKGVFDSIGNLVPLSSHDNSSLGSKDPIDKLKTYSDNKNFYSVSEVVEVLERTGEFDIEQIKIRITNIANHAYENVFSIKK